MEDLEFGLIETTAPAVEPVSLDEAKQHLLVTHADDDDDITRKIKAARRACEQICRRSFITTTWRYCLERWPGGAGLISLPRPRLIAVSSVTYLDTAGVRQTLAANTDYTVTGSREPAIVLPAYGKAWPGCRQTLESVQVTYTAGYGAAVSAVPDDIKAAVLLVLGHLYTNREDVITGTIATQLPMAARNLLAPYVVHWSM